MTATPFNGLLVLDKPGGMTSRDAVNRVQRWFPRRTRLGHTGTLDPLATGVLILCVGGATRLAEYVQAMDKTYRARLLLGARSDTDDSDGTVTPMPVYRPPDRTMVQHCLEKLIGTIEQVPPAYSAAHVAGRRAYDLARRGEEVALLPRRVRVYGIDLLVYEYPHAELEVRCGKGTYIRSLARDLGEHLGCGALVETLRRTRVGPFTLDNAVLLDTDPVLGRARLLPLAAAVAELPRLTLDAEAIARLCHGQTIPLPGPSMAEAAKPCAIFNAAGGLVAVANYDPTRAVLSPNKVLEQPNSQE